MVHRHIRFEERSNLNLLKSPHFNFAGTVIIGICPVCSFIMEYNKSQWLCISH